MPVNDRFRAGHLPVTVEAVPPFAEHSQEEFLARYDPRAVDLVAVTVDPVAVTADPVTLTVRDGAAAGAGAGTRRSFGRYSWVLELF